jgi:hypothetical protein
LHSGTPTCYRFLSFSETAVSLQLSPEVVMAYWHRILQVNGVTQLFPALLTEGEALFYDKVSKHFIKNSQ